MCSYPRAQTSSSNSSALFTAREVLLDIIDRILDETNVFGFVVGYLNVEFVLDVHHKFNEIEGIGPQILDKIGLGDDLDSSWSSCSAMIALTRSSILAMTISPKFEPVLPPKLTATADAGTHLPVAGLTT